MSPLLCVRGLTKDYASRRLLHIDALDLAAGQRYVISGDNGAGKSTLLRILAGLEKAAIAEFRYKEQAIDSACYPRWVRNEVIYVHQHPYLFHTSIAANIAYGLAVRKIAKETQQKAVEEALTWAGVAHLQAVPPQKLSGGEKQRVALARARALHPKLLLLDEPTANLDADARAQIIVLLDQLADRDTCVVIACHDREIMELPDTVRLHLEQGGLTLMDETGA